MLIGSHDYLGDPYHILIHIRYRSKNLLDEVRHDDIALLLERIWRTEGQLCKHRDVRDQLVLLDLFQVVRYRLRYRKSSAQQYADAFFHAPPRPGCTTALHSSGT